MDGCTTAPRRHDTRRGRHSITGAGEINVPPDQSLITAGLLVFGKRLWDGSGRGRPNGALSPLGCGFDAVETAVCVCESWGDSNINSVVFPPPSDAGLLCSECPCRDLSRFVVFA